MHRVLLASSHAHPRAQPFDADLVDHLRAVGIDADYVPWNLAGVDWASADAVILRSTWDYDEHLPEFLDWTREVERQTRLHNPSRLVAWNTHKGYLRDLEAKGLDIVPTHWSPRGSEATLASILAENGWTHAVAKPAVSLGAKDTRRINTATAAQHETWWRNLNARQDMMVQPFLPAIETEGELSFLVFRGQLSHAVCKRPKGGDFRVQAWHGGTSTPYDATPAEHAEALRYAQAVAEPLYARVDMVRHEGRLHLMELELIEPNLFLDTVPGAARRFAEAVRDELGG